MSYDVIIVGGGIAGLTAASYLAKDGQKVLLCEKENELGGLVSSFDYKGFKFDGGIRAIENSGIVMPMLRQLGIEIPFIRSVVSLGIEKDIIRVQDKTSLEDYKALLVKKYPDNQADINAIIVEIEKIMEYMDILYGIDNPLFMDMLKDKKYLFKTILPWLFKYLLTIRKINQLDLPVETYLKGLTDNQSLNDLISQHFFTNTPTFFALSYFSLYLDYQYPKNGTGMMIDRLKEFFSDHGGTIKTNTQIVSINPSTHQVTDQSGQAYDYRSLLWASDLGKLYDMIDLEQLEKDLQKKKVDQFRQATKDLRGGNSIQTVYATVNIEPSYFQNICSEHFFYTPSTKGISEVMAALEQVTKGLDKKAMLSWLKKYLSLTTYEISIPVLRNKALAPEGKTGLIISVLMDYDFVKAIETTGWYDSYKSVVEETMIDVLNGAVFDQLKENLIDTFSSSPLTIEKRTGNRDGAITGWAFTNEHMPVVHRMTRVAASVKTKIPNIYQAGQWAYSPSGLPISILTAKLAADQIAKANRKRRKVK